ncbi:MAG: UPF0175 family protein [Treponema sp.]|nr:UPF0175 family protein [Treponema sp.]
MEVTLTVPDVANLSKVDAQLLFAIKLFETQKLSIGKAAEVAGLSYRTFREMLMRYEVPIVSMTEEDVRQEVANVDRLLR